MEPKRYTKDDVIINLRDMVWHILRRWRSIVVGVVVFTILAGGYKYLQDYRQYQNRLAAQKQETAVETNLSEKEQMAVNTVISYQRAHQTQAEYNAYAPLMHIDPGYVHTTVFSGVVSGQRSYAAAQLYSQMLTTDAACQEIADALEWKKALYVQDLVEIKVLADDRATQIDDSVVLQVRVYAPTKEQSQTMARLLSRRLPTLTAAVYQTVGYHGLNLSSADYRVEINDDLRSTQQSYINQAKMLQSQWEDANGKLSGLAKAYIKELDTESQDALSSEPTLTPPSVSLKHLVLGFGGGLALFVALYAVTYILNKRVKSADDMASRYALPVFGVLPQADGEKKTCILDRWLKALFCADEKNLSPRDREEWIFRQVVLTARKAGAQTVYITGSELSAEELERLTNLAQAASAEGLTLRVGDCPLHDTAAMEQLADADGLLLVEKAEVSTYAAVERELVLSERFGVPALGAVLLS